MKKKLKKWVKVVITLMLVLVGIIVYHIMCFKGAYASENTISSIFICLGWFWLLAGQIMVLYVIWEK